MASFENDSNPDNEWDDSWETIWNEFDWERYLNREKDQVRKYQKFYNKLIRSQNRLDEVALFMGWESGNATGDTSDSVEISLDSLPDQPYTLHKHPLFIASKALHDWLREAWTQRISLCDDQIAASKALEVQNAISQSDYYGLLAVTALDLGDYSLAIAYFKRGLVALNSLLALLSEVEQMDIDALAAYAKQAKTRLFDIREIWLRVTADCRAAAAKRFDEE
jgi:hypothetical protein